MKLLFENWRKYLTEQVMLAPDGSSATIVFKFDGMNFEGREEEQETFFIKDPHGNILELKTLKN